MKSRAIHRASLAATVLCLVAVSYTMVAILIYREQVFWERGIGSSGGELSILLAVLFVAAFDIVSVGWLSLRIRSAETPYRSEVRLRPLGILCILLVGGTKVLVDEISHEYSAGLSVVGEWTALYFCLTIQLIYAFSVMFALRRKHQQM